MQHHAGGSGSGGQPPRFLLGWNMVYPFCAIVGQENAKLALLLNLINPSVCGVLICGEKGTAKSTLARGLGALDASHCLVELPLNATEDRLLGSIDLERALFYGESRYEGGILARADGNLLYIDEVNLLSRHLVKCLIDSAASGVGVVERDGVSQRHAARFALIGSMNPEEGALSPQFLDRFGLSVSARAEHDVEKRAEIIRRRLLFERDPADFARLYERETAELRANVARAKAALPCIHAAESALALAAELAHQACCEGNRAEILLAEAGRALAAWEGAEAACPEHIRRVAAFVLMHRMRGAAEIEEISSGPSNAEERERLDAMPPADAMDAVDEAAANGHGAQSERLDAPGELFRIGRWLDGRARKPEEGSGRRMRVRAGSCRGKHVFSRAGKAQSASDIALLATLRAAAIRRAGRGFPENGRTLEVRPEDIRVKVRERRTGSSILFVVDASASMGAMRRMAAVKGAILSLLNDAYQKRDRVGLVVFKGVGAELKLNFTRSVAFAQKQLAVLATNGKTPLAQGLTLARAVVAAGRLKDKETLPVIVLVTDGRATYPPGAAVEEALEAARAIAAARIRAVVVDTEQGAFRLGFARNIAINMGAQALSIEELKAEPLAGAVRAAVAAGTRERTYP